MKKLEDNTIVGWLDGKAIIANESGDLFYYEMPQEFTHIGEAFTDTELMKSVEELLPEEIIAILDSLADENEPSK